MGGGRVRAKAGGEWENGEGAEGRKGGREEEKGTAGGDKERHRSAHSQMHTCKQTFKHNQDSRIQSEFESAIRNNKTQIAISNQTTRQNSACNKHGHNHDTIMPRVGPHQFREMY